MTRRPTKREVERWIEQRDGGGDDETCDRDERGRFTERVTDGEFIEAIRKRDLPTTSDIADAVDTPYRTAYGRLGDLETEGHVRSRKIGNSLVWSVAEADEEEN